MPIRGVTRLYSIIHFPILSQTQLVIQVNQYLIDILFRFGPVLSYYVLIFRVKFFIKLFCGVVKQRIFNTEGKAFGRGVIEPYIVKIGIDFFIYP